MSLTSCADPDGERGPDTPIPKNHKALGFLSDTCPGPLKITKLTSQHSMLAFILNYLNGVSLAGRLWPTFSGDPLSPHKLKIVKKLVSRVGPPLTKTSGSAHVVVVQWVGLWAVIVTSPGHTHLLVSGYPLYPRIVL